MTTTCIHVFNAKLKLINLSKKMIEYDPSLLEKFGPYVELKDIENCSKDVKETKELEEVFDDLVNFYNKIINLNAIILKRVDVNILHNDYLVSIDEQLSKCDCISKGFAAIEQLEIKEKEHEELKNLFTSLQIMTNNKDHELEKKERKIRELKELLGKSQEEIIDYKLKTKEGKMETLIQKLEIDRTQIRDLRKTYQKFIIVRGENNQDEIDEYGDKIEEIKDKLIDGGIDIVNAEKLCQKCEKLAKLKVEQDQLFKERFEARQEVIVYNNRN